MNVFMLAALFNTGLGFAISNMMLFASEVDKTMDHLQYVRVVPIQKWKPKTTAQRQSARRTLFRRHHQKIKKTMF